MLVRIELMANPFKILWVIIKLRYIIFAILAVVAEWCVHELTYGGPSSVELRGQRRWCSIIGSR